MARETTLSVRVTGPLSDFIAETVGDDGPYESSSEYVRDLIRRDKEHKEVQAFERLKAELQAAFAVPDGQYAPVTAADVIARNKARAAA